MIYTKNNQACLACLQEKPYIDAGDPRLFNRAYLRVSE